MTRKLFRGMLGLPVLITLYAGLFGIAAGNAAGAEFEVTVTNLTRGQIISPAVVATHTDKLDPLFTLGSPASDELVAVAEDAVNGPLVDALSGDKNVKDVQTTGGPIMPGESASVVVGTAGKFRNITVVGMLVTTNDAFFALKGVRGPKRGSDTHFSPAYDAGSEANNESCAFIPGPPCGNPDVHTEEAEGYVHIHAGIHGIGNLDPAVHDWRNPVAKVTIRRISNYSGRFLTGFAG